MRAEIIGEACAASIIAAVHVLHPATDERHVRCPCLENAKTLALYNLEPTAEFAIFMFSSIPGALPMQVQD